MARVGETAAGGLPETALGLEDTVVPADADAHDVVVRVSADQLSKDDRNLNCYSARLPAIVNLRDSR